MQEHTAMSGKTLNGPHRPPRTFQQGRVCAESDCGTRLSIYNESRYCSLHGSRNARRVERQESCVSASNKRSGPCSRAVYSSAGSGWLRRVCGAVRSFQQPGGVPGSPSASKNRSNNLQIVDLATSQPPSR